jgi:hypothetical protein
MLLFIPMGLDYVPELWPTAGQLFIPHVMYENGEPWWNDIDRGKSKNSERNLSQCHSVHHKSHIFDYYLQESEVTTDV